MTDALQAEEGRWAVAIHGGAMGSLSAESQDRRAQMEASLERVLQKAVAELAAGDSSLDVVERVVKALEDDPLFNAGRGAVLNADGQHELDASIMDGRTLQCGAVAAVRTVKNPIALARLVMEKTPHVLLVANGAEAFAEQMHVARADAEYFRTPERVSEWERLRRRQPSPDGQAALSESDLPFGTVGCVARDRSGNLAAATSTGGIVFKKYGRVGDSPIIGAGTYADNQTCAVSCTGRGEEFIRRGVAFQVSLQMRLRQVPLDQAAQAVLDQLPPASGGLIAVDHHGNVVARFNTPGMARALASSGQPPQVVVGQ
jgi:beta-aspartyl-peptidase (threonine type)